MIRGAPSTAVCGPACQNTLTATCICISTRGGRRCNSSGARPALRVPSGSAKWRLLLSHHTPPGRQFLVSHSASFFFVRFVFFFFLLSTFFLHHRRGSLNCAAPVFFVCTTLHTSRDTIPMNVGGSCVAPFFPQQWQRQRGSHARGRRQRWGIFRGPRKPSPRRGTGEGHGPSSVAGRTAECSDGWPGKLLLFFLLPGARPGPARPVRWLGETEPWEVLLQRCRMMMSGGKIVSLAMRTRYSVQHPSAVLQPASFAVEGRIQVYAPCFNVLYVRPCLC